MKFSARHIIVSLMVLAATGCHDEFLEEETAGDGKARISATLDFKPMFSALARTRTDGDALKDITSLHVLLYDGETKKLKETWEIASDKYTVSDEERSDEDAENGNHAAETTTKHVSFKLTEEIGFGRYYMYAVANIPDLLTNAKYSEAIKTVDDLKNIPLAWDSENMAANGQMIGHFTKATAQSADETLVLSEKSENLHAWLRRAASKVTVSFNGSNLKEGVSIYLKALRIKNIPVSCKLGAENAAGKEEDLIDKGEEVVYSTSTSYDANHPALISKERPFFPRKQEGDGWIQDPDSHSETNSHSLFFYENMQGTGPDKQQRDDANTDGILDELYPYKDMPYATYIEVDAYYESTNPGRPGMCNITYRFMLGQNVRTDYNAKRNCHYKLTLNFKGFADEPDWRIDYVTRLWVTQPEAVDYRGKYFAPVYEDKIYNRGNDFKDDNAITVTSFMYDRDSWEDRTPVEYKIEYREAGSAEFTETPPSWLGKFDPPAQTHEGNGVYKLKIKYNNPFTEVPINDTLSRRPAKSNYDLSTKGGSKPMNTANCYIVDSKGTYRFPLVYGNAVTDGNENETSYIYQGTGSGANYLARFKNYNDAPIGSPYILDDIYGSADKAPELTASLVWQDVPSLITDIAYVSGGKGSIRFTVGDKIKEGNAVIALKDPSGTIMWSWHIWVTAIDLSRTITIKRPHLTPDQWNTFPEQNFEIMPVNLGWCSGDIPVRYYDRHECEVRFTQLISDDGQEGLSKTVMIIQEPHIALPMGNNPYFQWGRKDPFFAGGNGNGTTKTWYDAGDNPKTSAPAMMYPGSDDKNRVETYKATAELIKNPDKWQNGPRQSPGDWGNPYKPNDNIFLNMWDNSCWDGRDDVVKTVYDPCPAGYHVSSAYTFAGFTANGGPISHGSGDNDIKNHMYAATEENMIQEDDYKNGIFEFYTDRTKLVSIGFPANGYRDWDANAALLQYGQGQIWLAQSSPYSSPHYNAYHLEYTRLTTGFTPHIFPWNNYYATDGFAVRPSITLP